MPIKNGVGFGTHTELKINHLRNILAMHINITGAVIDKCRYYERVYHYIDATAGPGKCPELGLIGSPMVFIKTAQSKGLYCKCDLIEIRQEHCDSLSRNLNQHQCINGTINIHCDDYAEVLSTLMLPNRNQLGLIFVDPSGEVPDFEVIGKALEGRPRMEVLFYLPAANLKRFYHHTGMKLANYMQQVHKNHWLIREPVGRHQWTFLLGSNTDLFKSYSKIGFYRFDSLEAQRIFPVLNFTKDELQHAKQASLLFPEDDVPYRTYSEYLQHPRYLTIRQIAIDRSNGSCELCERCIVTEVHHVEYPKWGTFEKNADKLLALCHQCHCKIHGKDN